METIDLTKPGLDKALHLKYWRRCLKTLLPHYYTGNDSNRMNLAFFIISALDLLDGLDEVCTAEEKQDYINWVYRCQHPSGGFRAWPGTDFGERANEANSKWDPANIPATYFALAILLMLGDNLQRVHWTATLRWLQRLQREDGSFGETLVEDNIEGGRDPRFSYCATGVRYILRGNTCALTKSEYRDIPDINIDALVSNIRQAESFDGGIADEEFGEPHAGYTYCSIGALNNVGRLNTRSDCSKNLETDPTNSDEALRWLVYRQTDLLYDDLKSDHEPPGSEEGDTGEPHPPPSDESVVEPSQSCAGMNGRINKIADTCYAWWSSAPMHLLGCPHLYDSEALRNYLLEKAQHRVLGGFGKCAGDLPDLYHSSLGLAALSLTGYEGIKEIDAGMCISKDAKARISEAWTMWGVS